MLLNKKLLKPTYFIAILLAFLVPLITVVPASAATNCYYDPTTGTGDEKVVDCSQFPAATFPGGSPGTKCYAVSGLMPGVSVSEISCSDSRFGGANGSPTDSCSIAPPSDPCHNVIVQKYIDPAINFLAIGFGIIVTIMVVIGGLQYITAGSDPQKVAAAKNRIFNAILALVAFAFMYVILQWLVPGGIF